VARMRRIAAVILMVAALVVGGCGGSEQETASWLGLVVSVSNLSPRVGQSTTLRLRATNRSHIPQSLTFTSSQRYDFIVRDVGGEVVWNWASGQQFSQALSREIMQPGETWTFTKTWDLRDNNEEALAAAQYTAQGELACLGTPQTQPVVLIIGPARICLKPGCAGPRAGTVRCPPASSRADTNSCYQPHQPSEHPIPPRTSRSPA